MRRSESRRASAALSCSTMCSRIWYCRCLALSAARAALTRAATRIGRSRPQISNTIRLLKLPVPVQQRVAAGVLSAGHARAILALVALVLLLACANVANLVLAKSSARARDLALRTAMGATRLRIVRQLLTESGVLAIAGGAAGSVIAGWVLVYLSRVVIIPSALPLWIDLRLDMRVLAFTAAGPL